MSRVILWLVALTLIVALALGTMATLLLDDDKLIALASEAIERQTGAQLEVGGKSSLSFFPKLQVTLEDAALNLPEEQGVSLSVKALDIGVQFMPLLKREIAIDRISVQGLLAILPRQETPELDTSDFTDAELEAFYAARREALAAAAPASDAAAVMVAPLALQVDRLTVTDSIIRRVDGSSGESTDLEIVSLSAGGLNLESNPVELQAQLQMAAGEDRAPAQLSLKGVVRFDQASQLLTLEPLTMALKGPVAQALKITARGEIRLAAQQADLKLEINSGDTLGSGSVRYASFESPQIDANLKLNLFDPALLALAGPEAGAKTRPGATQTPGVSDTTDNTETEQALPLDAIRSIDTRARLAIDRLVLQGQSISNLRMQLRAKEGLVKIRSMTGEVHGGKLSLQGTLDARRSKARLETEGTLIALDIPSLLNSLNQEPVMSGMADIDWSLESRGVTSTELIKALEGPIEIEARDAVLQDIGVEQMLCQVVALINREPLSNELPTSSRFDKFSAKLKLRDGKLRLSPLNIELPQVKLRGEGRLYLLEQNFRAKFSARLSPELSRLDPACRVNERLTAIDWPINCKGEIGDDPASWCSVDSEEILSDLATDELQRKIKKEAGKWLDKIIPD